ncbi:DNA polymerase IV [Pendulispora brunnea]|uniref:DNA polymerase IV n=1 Tax=Pendulispora brunnea TaxID=2905690 RepID=A0ABZ2K9A7_9BACT
MPRPRSIVHVDMDAFYASVEIRDDPRLAGKPVLVGGSKRRGVVLAASYEARKFGPHSAMSMAEAMRLCPQALVVPPRHDRYAEVSRSVFAIFERYTPLVEGLSVDEAFLDVTESRSLFGDGETIARAIKGDVKGELGLTASAGVAPSKFVAKVASDLQKPDGLVVVPDGGVAAFLAPLPIERMWGVGPKTAPRLRALGLRTLGDLASADPRALDSMLGSWGRHVRDLARGIDPRDVEPDRAAKSVGHEETYEEDLRTAADIERTLLRHASRVAQRLLEAGLAGNIVVVKLKYADFTLRTRRISLPEPVADTNSIFTAARGLLREFDPGPVRLTGVSLSGLVDTGADGAGVQRKLFEDEKDVRREQFQRVEEVVRAIGQRFGEGVTRAALLDKDEKLARGRKTR